MAEAARGAAEAARELRSWPTHGLAELLEACAAALEEVREPLLELADRETALGVSPRLQGELERTTGQLRAFARMVREGWHFEAIIDRARDGQPDVRRMLVPVGPVAVFGASNFPLAFSVPGGRFLFWRLGLSDLPYSGPLGSRGRTGPRRRPAKEADR